MIPTAASDIGSIAHASFCDAAKPISWAADDSEETLHQIWEHNCVGHVLCGWPADAELCGGEGEHA